MDFAVPVTSAGQSLMFFVSLCSDCKYLGNKINTKFLKILVSSCCSLFDVLLMKRIILQAQIHSGHVLMLLSYPVCIKYLTNILLKTTSIEFTEQKESCIPKPISRGHRYLGGLSLHLILCL